MEPTDLSGAVLDGRYKVIEPISEGAMGVVYRAERLKLGRIVAIKVLHDELPAELSSRKRFEIEAMAMAKLEHPHCAAVIDVGVHDDKPFVVMDFVSGDNLRDVIAKGPMPIPRAVEIVRQVLSGLAHAHEHGIIHRDIKPANIVLSQKAGLGDHVKILDFGLARLDNTAQNITTGIVVGTPSYMSPEQIRGVLIDQRSDIYACGVLLFELLTGEKPFVSEKDDPVEVCSMHLKQTPPTLASRQAGITFDTLEDIVARALAKKPDDRFATAVEFAAALDGVSARRSQPIAAPVPPPSTSAVASETGWAVPVEAKSSFYPPADPAPVEAAPAPVEAMPAPISPPAPIAPPADPPRRPGGWDPDAPSQPSTPIVDPVSGPTRSARPVPVPFNRRVPTPIAGSPTARPVAPTPIAGSPTARPVAPTPIAGSPLAPTPMAATPIAGSPVAPVPPTAPMAWVAPMAVPTQTTAPATQPTTAPHAIGGAPHALPIDDPAQAFAGSPVGQVVPPYASPPAGLERLVPGSVEPPASSEQARGLPADFDLSRAIPREAVNQVSAKGLSPGFDLSLAIPQAPESPILEKSGQVASGGVPSGSVASGGVGSDASASPADSSTPIPEAAPELTTAPAGAITAPTANNHDATILGLAVVPPKPAGDTVPASPPPMAKAASADPADSDTVPAGPPPMTAKPTDETALEVPVATSDASTSARGPARGATAPVDAGEKPDRETVAFLGTAPAGPSPLAASDAPAIAEPEPPRAEPWQPSKRQIQAAIGTIGLVILIIIVVSIAKCGGGTRSAVATPDAAVSPPPPANPADDQLAKATELYAAGRSDAALDTLLAARKTSPKDPRLSYLAGKIYFDKQWWSVGLKQFRDTLALDPTYRSDPDMIKIVLKAFITPAEYHAELGSFLRNDIGAPAKPYLQETAASHPRAATRTRAKRELDKMP